MGKSTGSESSLVDIQGWEEGWTDWGTMAQDMGFFGGGGIMKMS